MEKVRIKAGLSYILENIFIGEIEQLQQEQNAMVTI